MVSGTDAWENEYTRKGKLWSGVIHDLPEMPAGSQVLDLGCGNGKTLPVMINRRWNVTALDISGKAVTFSRNVSQGPSPAEVMVADARNIPFKSSKFDAVFAIHMIGHVHETDRELIAREVSRILKKGGILFFCDFSTYDVRFGNGKETEPSTFLRGTEIITHYFTRQEVIDLFPGLNCGSVTLHQWLMRVRGKHLERSEVIGVFYR
ncbi:MAG: class I SAM-dependent methyltransferase [Methanoregula sp.]|nr:class I SAM-dependent methyltransferase [Methanoregula sp.]